MLEFHVDKKKLRVYLTMQSLGTDMCVHIFGGTATAENAEKEFDGQRETYPVHGAHIGAVALALPPASTFDAGGCNNRNALARASLLTVPGHKEDKLARSLALRAACRCKARVVLACGLHVDNATLTDIRNLERMAGNLMEALIVHLHSPHEDTHAAIS